MGITKTELELIQDQFESMCRVKCIKCRQAKVSCVCSKVDGWFIKANGVKLNLVSPTKVLEPVGGAK